MAGNRAPASATSSVIDVNGASYVVSAGPAGARLAAQTFSMPLQKPPPTVERPIAPVEAAGQAFDAACEGSDDWDKPAPPVGVYGNTYYVGTCGISAILITSPQGHILIDSGTEAGAELVAENIRALGFRLTDVKFLLGMTITTTLAAWRASSN